MDHMVMFLLGVLVVFTNYIISSSSALRITVTPAVYTRESSGPVNISCFLDATDAHDTDIYMMQIVRDGGAPIAFIRSSGMYYGSQYKGQDKFQASGVIAQNVTKSFLSLSIFPPNVTDGGAYTCKVIYSDWAGQLQERSTSGNLALENLDLNDVVRRLLDKVSVLESRLEDQTAKDREMTEEIKNLTSANDQLKETAAALEEKGRQVSYKLAELATATEALLNSSDRQETEIFGLGSKDREICDKLAQLTETAEILTNISQKQGSEITYLSNKVSYSSAFSVLLSKPTVIPTGTIVFDMVSTNQGDGYAKESGIYTAPRDGLYGFHLAMMVYPDKTNCCNGDISLWAQGREIARLRVEVTSSYKFGQSSVSQVVHLAKGDEVSARALTKIQYYGFPYSLYSGHLIRAD